MNLELLSATKCPQRVIEHQNGRVIAIYSSKDAFQRKQNEKGDFVCLNCGKSLAFDRRRTRFCSDNCWKEYVEKNVINWVSIRQVVLDNANGKCEKCGVKTDLIPTEEDVLASETDHIIPLFKGGKDWDNDPELLNFQNLCYKCHKKKSREEAKERTKLGMEVISGKQKQLVVFA